MERMPSAELPAHLGYEGGTRRLIKPISVIADNEGARLRLSVMTEPKSLGVQDVLIAADDRRKGFPWAITAAVPEKDTVPTCIIHPVRHAVNVCA